MITNGTRPSYHIPKRKFHDHFGSVINPSAIPDFTVDSGVNGMPDQDKDSAHTECTGYAVADILADVYKRRFSPDFSYAANFYTTGEQPTLDGASFTGAVDATIAVGALPLENAGISAATKGELFVANWSAWDDAQKKLALQYVQNGDYNVLGAGDAFDSILSALYLNRIGIFIGSPWFQQWVFNIDAGVVQLPVLNGQYLSWHDYAIKGKKTINGVPYLMVKSWQGTRVGDGGWLYFSREVINAAMTVEGAGALTIAVHGNRWWSLVGILFKRFPGIWFALPALLKA